MVSVVVTGQKNYTIFRQHAQCHVIKAYTQLDAPSWWSGSELQDSKLQNNGFQNKELQDDELQDDELHDYELHGNRIPSNKLWIISFNTTGSWNDKIPDRSFETTSFETRSSSTR